MPAVTGVILANAPGDDLAHDLSGRSCHALPVGGIPLATRARAALRGAGAGRIVAAVSPDTRDDLDDALGDRLEVTAGSGPAQVLELAAAPADGDLVVLHAGDGFAGDAALRTAVRAGADGVVRCPSGAPVAVVLTPATARAAVALPARDLAGLVAGLRGAGHDLREHPGPGAWSYDGTGDGLLEGNRVALDALVGTGTDADVSHARVSGRVVIHPTAVLERALVRGPAWIGPRAVLVDAFVGPYTAIGERVRVQGAEVEHALLMAGASIRHLDRRLEASVVGRDARVTREFSVPANLRVRIGRGAEVALS